MDDVKIEFNDKYGVVQEYILVQLDSNTPWMVATVEFKEQEYIEIRKMYWNKEHDGLSFGKGARIPMDNDVAEDVLDAATSLLLKDEDLL